MGPSAASCARLGAAASRPPGRPELSKLGALVGADPTCSGETPRRTCVAGGRELLVGRAGAPSHPASRARLSARPPARLPACLPAGPPAQHGEAAAARAARQAFAERCAALRCAPDAAFPGRAVNLCGDVGLEAGRASVSFPSGRCGPGVRERRAHGGLICGKCSRSLTRSSGIVMGWFVLLSTAKPQ